MGEYQRLRRRGRGTQQTILYPIYLYVCVGVSSDIPLFNNNKREILQAIPKSKWVEPKRYNTSQPITHSAAATGIIHPWTHPVHLVIRNEVSTFQLFTHGKWTSIFRHIHDFHSQGAVIFHNVITIFQDKVYMRFKGNKSKYLRKAYHIYSIYDRLLTCLWYSFLLTPSGCLI